MSSYPETNIYYLQNSIGDIILTFAANQKENAH